MTVAHTGPLHTRVEQLSHTLHTNLGQLRNDLGRLRTMVDSFLVNANQAQALGLTVSGILYFSWFSLGKGV